MGRNLLFLMLVMLVALSGCAPARSGFYTVASTSQGADALGTEYVLVQKDATATASVPIIFVPFGVPRDYDAMQDVLDENDGDLLTNVRVTSSYSIFLMFGTAKTSVTADVWRVAGKAEVESGMTTPLDALFRTGNVALGNHGEGGFAGEEASR